MRLDLETIKKIEFYLADSMTPIEKKIFEQEIANDVELKNAVEEQRDLMNALEKTQLKSNAVTAYKIYNRKRTYRLVAGILLPVIILGGAIGGYAYFNSKPQVNKQIVPNTTIAQNTTTPSDTEDFSYKESKQEEPVIEKRTHYKTWVKDVVDEYDLGLIPTSDTSTQEISTEKRDVFEEKQTTQKTDSVKLKTDNTVFFEKIKKKKSQVFKRKADRDICIVAEEGTMIGIPANSLVNAKGEKVNGEVEIEITEYYKKSDVILGNLHSMSNNDLLESGGMLHITTKQKNEELALATGQSMQVLFLTRKKNDKMEVFTGVPGESGVNWIPQNSKNESREVVYNDETNREMKKRMKDGDTSFTLTQDYINVGYKWGNGWYDMATNEQVNKFNKLMMSVNKMGWINCDRFSQVKEKTNLKIHVDGPKDTYVDVRVIFKEINSVMGVYGSESVRKVSNIPVDYKVTVIAFAYKDKEFYYTSQDAVVTPNQDIYITLEKTTEEFIENEMKKFDGEQKFDKDQKFN